MPTVRGAAQRLTAFRHREHGPHRGGLRGFGMSCYAAAGSHKSGVIVRYLIVGLLSVLAAALVRVESVAAAGSPAFCGTWLKLCNRTCPGGPGTCSGVCSARYTACLASGCFQFNVPGPRCQGNARDETATSNVKKAIRAGRPVGCGPRFGGRPCD